MPRSRQAGNLFYCQRKQRGAALMVMLVVMVMGAATILVSSLSRSALRIQQNQNYSLILAQTKENVMGNIMSGIGGQIPGNVLRPDAFASTESPYDYDGTAETGCFDASKPGSTPIPGLQLISSGTNMRCLGRLPWKDYGMSISAPSENDPSGVMPWYAVSANLVDPANVIFNPDLLNTNPTHPWLTVRDMNGSVLSNRVAIVIILPGVALPGQSRPPSPNLAGPNQYLDSITVPDGCTAPCVPGTYKNYDLDDDFIMGDEHRWIKDPNNNASQIEDSGYRFNDKLTYITIDELMPLIEKRVGNEIKKELNVYYATWGAFPFAALFTDPSTSTFSGQAATYNGLLPVGNTITPVWNANPAATFINGSGTATCTRRPSGCTTNCTYWRCDLTNITGTPTIRITGTLNGIGLGMWRYDPSIGSTNTASCTQDVCVRIGNYYPASNKMDNVSVSGSLNTSGNATVTFSGTVRAGNIPTRIQLYPGVVPSHLPPWFGANNWNQFMYYAASQGYAPGGGSTCNPLPGTPSCLTVNGNGGGNNKQAVVIMASGALSGQTRSSGTLSSYLEGENATQTNFIYENKTRSSTFNDQVIIVAP